MNTSRHLLQHAQAAPVAPDAWWNAELSAPTVGEGKSYRDRPR